MNELTYGKQVWDFEDVNDVIDEFMDIYSKRPISNNQGGMLSAHLFWAWYVVKKLKPVNIIESGVYKGQGTWVFRQAHPSIRIFSIDPSLSARVYIDEKATYFSEDFSLIDWKEYLDPRETLIFFDDHQNAYERLLQMKWMGFDQAMFEDNYPAGHGDCYSIKKIFAESGHGGGVKTFRLRRHFRSTCEEVIRPNKVHAQYVKSNIETYTTFPPLYKPEITRWGDTWDEINYPTAMGILSVEKLEQYPLIKEEAKNYTWICYVKLNSNK